MNDRIDEIEQRLTRLRLIQDTYLSLLNDLRKEERSLTRELDLIAYKASDYIEELGLSVRVFNSLHRIGIRRIDELLHMIENSPDWRLPLRNFGDKSEAELMACLKGHGYTFRIFEYKNDDTP